MAGATGHKLSASSSLSRQLLLHLEPCGEALASGCWEVWLAHVAVD